MNSIKIAQELIRVAKELVGSEYRSMSLQEIAGHISDDWKPVNYAAKPYLEALFSIDNSGHYGLDPWQNIVAYFLSNASSWRGDVAREVKKELKRRLKSGRMAKIKTALPMVHAPAYTDLALQASKKLKSKLRLPSSAKAIASGFYAYEEYGSPDDGGKDSNKFIYVAVYDRGDGQFVSGRAWGRIGYKNLLRALELEEGSEEACRSAVENYVRSKVNRGRDPYTQIKLQRRF